MALALHHLRFKIEDGQIGTADWDPASDDLGADGIAGTSDKGENDGIPTPGEPNLAPVAVGPGRPYVGLLVHVSDTETEGVKRIIATSFTEDGSVTLETLVQKITITIPDQQMPSGTHSDVAWGDWSTADLQITYCSGNLHLSGQGSGAGVLIVDGDLDVSGEFEFTGLVIVTGEANFTGGGWGTHLWGTVLAKDGLRVQGSSEIRYCSEALEALAELAGENAGYETVYYAERSD